MVCASTLTTKRTISAATLFHLQTDDPGFCPVRAAAHIVHRLVRLQANAPQLPISMSFPGRHVPSADITTAVRHSVLLGNLLPQGYTVSRVSAHSLRASGAMALKINGHDKAIIKKLGRWSSTTWLTYIHSQIASLTTGLATSMCNQHTFFNVG